jgi:hypothetical protein
MILVIIVLILILLFYIPTLGDTEVKEINSFEECAAAGNPVMESYPRQCRTTDGRIFTEVITWRNDGIDLMQDPGTEAFGCFGCNDILCVDPMPQMVTVKEEITRYCSNDFEIIENERIFCTEESRNAEACIALYDPVCGWNDPEKIQCIKFPCASTYSNSCFACMDENVLYYTKGVCPE